MLPLPPRRELPGRLARLLPGLVLFGIGIALMVDADIGLSPWQVLHQGISRRTGIPLGTVVIIVGVIVLSLWIPLRERIGLGTLGNVIIIGVVLDIALWLSPIDELALWQQVAMMVSGVATIGVASALYIGAGLGPGPRDGLMTGLAKRGYRIGLVRTAIEVTVLVIGWLLGGTVGIGTVTFALGVGPIIGALLPRLQYASHEAALERS